MSNSIPVESDVFSLGNESESVQSLDPATSSDCHHPLSRDPRGKHRFVIHDPKSIKRKGLRCDWPFPPEKCHLTHSASLTRKSRVAERCVGSRIIRTSLWLPSYAILSLHAIDFRCKTGESHDLANSRSFTFADDEPSVVGSRTQFLAIQPKLHLSETF